MFQIITNTTSPSLNTEPKDITIPCFYLTNSLTTMTNFAPLFTVNSNEEELIEDNTNFIFTTSTIPSEFNMVEIDINSLFLEDMSSLYLNGSKYQNLLELPDLLLGEINNFNTEELIVVEEREST